MRQERSWGYALIVALAGAAIARGDEPNRPTASASESKPAVPAVGHSIHGEPFDEGPRRKAILMKGMGRIDFPVTTAKGAEVQPFINQGVAQLHSFFYFEAERSFRQAALIDPDCAMAYWGMSMANVNNARRAKGFLKEAQARAGKAGPREKLYLDALAAFYRDGADDKTRRQGLLLGLESILQEFPNDANARAWLAMVTWQNAEADGIGSRQAVEGLIESVLNAEQTHPGAHHYRIHLWDGVKPSLALKSALLYARTAPGIAHAWHMPGHTYTSLHRFGDAAYQQEGSARVDHAYMARDRVMPFEIHNYAHNNQWLATSLSHIGRARDAVNVARNLVEGPRDPQKNGKNDGGSAQRSGRLRWAEVLVRHELWDDLIAATISGALDWSDVPNERKERAYTLGLAYAATGDKAKLAEQVSALKTLSDEESKKPLPGPQAQGKAAQDPALLKDVLAALAELEGRQKLAEGDIGAAFERFAQATSMRPEALARAHLAARNFGLAASTAKRAVEKAPNEVPPLAAYVEVLQASGKTQEAQKAYRTLEPLAREADPDLPVFRRLAPIVAAWKSAGAWSPTTASDFGGSRIDLGTLGPLTWSPFPAEPIALTDTEVRPWSLADHRGKNVIVLFFLGGKCAHCMQQLQTFGKELEAFQALNTEVVAIGTDDPEATRALKANAEGVKFPMPLLSDSPLAVFKAYRTFDDFENQPLHGTFLIDGRGGVRFQRISADPFLDVDFLKAEVARINRLAP